MEEKQSLDWNTDLKEIPVKEWETRFNWVEEPCISPDGEQIASVVNVDDMVFGICVYLADPTPRDLTLRDGPDGPPQDEGTNVGASS